MKSRIASQGMSSDKLRSAVTNTLPFLELCESKGGYSDPNYSCDEIDGFGYKQNAEKLTQNVATGEIAQGYLNLYAIDKKEEWLKCALESCQWLMDQQNKDGSWNEVLTYYNYPSIIASSIAGEALLQAYKVKKDKGLLKASEKCKEFILNSEVGHGIFRKSTFILSNTLNVNAHAGAFLAEYANITGDSKAKEAAKRAIFAIGKHQYLDGALPYTDGVRSYPSSLHYNIKPIHYQAVTLFYLLKIAPMIKDTLLENIIKKGTNYLQNCVHSNGQLQWQKSAFPFEYFQTAAYGFSMAVLSREKGLVDNMASVLEKERLADGGFARYQRLPLSYYYRSFVPHIIGTYCSGEYSLKDRLHKVKELVGKIGNTRDRQSHLFTTAKIFEGSTRALRTVLKK